MPSSGFRKDRWLPLWSLFSGESCAALVRSKGFILGFLRFWSVQVLGLTRGVSFGACFLISQKAWIWVRKVVSWPAVKPMPAGYGWEASLPVEAIVGASCQKAV